MFHGSKVLFNIRRIHKQKGDSSSYVCADGVIPKANVITFANAEGYKFYAEYNKQLRRSLKANRK